MPWREREKDPSVYYKPSPLSDDVVLGRNGIFEKAVNYRKVAAQQKDHTPNDKETRREWAKRFRGYDYVVKYYECIPDYNNWRTPRATKEIAPYIDDAFLELEYPNS